MKSPADEHLDAAVSTIGQVNPLTVDPSNPLHLRNTKVWVREAVALANPSPAINDHVRRAEQLVDRMIQDNNNFPRALMLDQLRAEFLDVVGELRVAIRDAGPNDMAKAAGLDWF